VSFLIPLLDVASFAGVAVAARRTQRLEAGPSGRRARLGRTLLGVVGYPAAVTLAGLLVGRGDVNAGVVALFALPGLVFGFLIGRLWIAWVPIGVAAAWLLVAYLSDPSCASSCGEDDTWTGIALVSAVFVVLPAVFSLLLGILARNVLRTRFAARQRRLGAPGTNGR